MSLDPQVEALLEAAARSGRAPINHFPPSEARVLFKEMRKPLLPPTPPIGMVTDFSIPGRRGAIPVRHYRPVGTNAHDLLPVLIYFHGGGWVVGDLESHDSLCRQLANGAECAVIAVDYRVGPEHKFPAALEDAEDVVRRLADYAAALNIDPSRIAVGGDSAGGNLATIVAMLCRDSGDPVIKYQLLIYPATDMAMDRPSHFEFGEGYHLTHDLMLYFRGHYLNGLAEIKDWRASPLLAPDHSGLPPAHIITAGFDPLRDEGKAYAEALAAAGVTVKYQCYEGMIHGFLTMSGVLRVANEAIADCTAQLKIQFN
ncbi:MAG: alpha/beta hydrolase [Pseudomonadota bacterium]|nr:alpha/beta hydrolase [Pseudomonadota bacterium]